MASKEVTMRTLILKTRKYVIIISLANPAHSLAELFTLCSLYVYAWDDRTNNVSTDDLTSSVIYSSINGILWAQNQPTEENMMEMLPDGEVAECKNVSILSIIKFPEH